MIYSLQTFADMHQMPLFETSALDDSRQDNVEAIFLTLAFKLKGKNSFSNCISPYFLA
jgi:Ras-related protein Rab-33B